MGVLQQGSRGLWDTYIRQEDGSRMDLDFCEGMSNQAQCCGMSSSEPLAGDNTLIKTEGPLPSTVQQSLHQFTTKLNQRPSEIENKCVVYERAFRKAAKENAFDDHKIDLSIRGKDIH